MKMKALDLYCGAGGATKGLQRAGFHVVGIDKAPQPRYCGDEFIQADTIDLGVFRHRLIESSFLMLNPAHSPHIGKIGDGKYQTVTGHAGGSSKRDGWKAGGVAEWRVAMGIDWMVGDELAEAIPPAYSLYVASQFLGVATTPQPVVCSDSDGPKPDH